MVKRWPYGMLLVVPTMALAQADRAQAWRDVFSGLWFFGVMIAAAAYLLVLRLRDKKVGLSKEEMQARAQKRLPIAIGALIAACVPLLWP